MKSFLNSYCTPCLLVACLFVAMYSLGALSHQPNSVRAVDSVAQVDDPQKKVLEEWAAEAFGEDDARALFDKMFEVEGAVISARFGSVEDRLAALENKPTPVQAPAFDPSGLEKRIKELEAIRAMAGGSGSNGSTVASPYAKKPSVVKSGSGSNGGSTGGSAGTVTYGTPQVVRSTGSHWSYPGSIDDHLRTGHGIANVSGMSHEDQLTLHDSLHQSTPVPVQSSVQVVQQTVPRFIPQALPKVQRTSVSKTVRTQNCPGGVCPTNSSLQYRSTTTTRKIGR